MSDTLHPAGVSRPAAVRIWASLLGVAALGWLALVVVQTRMAGPEAMAAPAGPAWRQAAGDIILLSVMWVVMMSAMMVPSAAPAVTLFAAISQSQGAGHRRTPLFTLGYLAVWAGFSLLAALAQWALSGLGLRDSLLMAYPVPAGAILVLAGAFQWSPFKHACLSHCRSPQGFFMQHWHAGPAGAFRLGARHGLYCLGCCAILMSVLFVTGTMNLLWAAGLAALVLVEKAMPGGRWLGRLAGLGLLGWGLWLIVNAIA